MSSRLALAMSASRSRRGPRLHPSRARVTSAPRNSVGLSKPSATPSVRKVAQRNSNGARPRWLSLSADFKAGQIPARTGGTCRALGLQDLQASRSDRSSTPRPRP